MSSTPEPTTARMSRTGCSTADPSVEVARDIVMVSGGLIPMELFEEESGFTRMLDGLRSLGRVIVFDRRGLGLSDPVPGLGARDRRPMGR